MYGKGNHLERSKQLRASQDARQEARTASRSGQTTDAFRHLSGARPRHPHQDCPHLGRQQDQAGAADATNTKPRKQTRNHRSSQRGAEHDRPTLLTREECTKEMQKRRKQQKVNRTSKIHTGGRNNPADCDRSNADSGSGDGGNSSGESSNMQKIRTI